MGMMHMCIEKSLRLSNTFLTTYYLLLTPKALKHVPYYLLPTTEALKHHLVTHMHHTYQCVYLQYHYKYGYLPSYGYQLRLQ